MENEQRYLETLRELKRSKSEIEKLQYRIKQYALLDQRKQEEIEDLKADLALKDDSLVNLATTQRGSSDQFLEQFSGLLMRLIMDFYNQMSEGLIKELLNILMIGPLQLQLVGLFISNPKKAWSIDELTKKLTINEGMLKPWINDFIKKEELVMFDTGEVQLRHVVVQDVYKYKDFAEAPIEELYVNTRKKIALARDQRSYRNHISQLIREINRRNLPKTKNDLTRIDADLSLGTRTADWIFEQLTKNMQIAYQEERSDQQRPPTPLKLRTTTVRVPVRPKMTTIPSFKPKPIPKRPGAFKVVTDKYPEKTHGSISPSSSKPFKVSTAPRPTLKSAEKVELAHVDVHTSPSYEKTTTTEQLINDVNGNTKLYDVFEKARAEITRNNSKEEIVLTLNKLLNTVGELEFSRVLYFINQEISKLKRQNSEFNKEEILSKLDQWQNM